MRASAAELTALLLPAMLALSPAALAQGPGLGDRARPALSRAGVPADGKPGAVAAAADLDVGGTEALQSGDALHERLGLRAAAALDATRFLSVGAELGGRYDHHAHDDGLLFQSELSARLAHRFGAWGLGFEAAAWVPGGPDIGTSLSALGADGRLLVSAQGERFVVAGFGGYRLDRSAQAGRDAARLAFGDRISLGDSDYDALLSGLGAAYLLGETTLFGEVSSQLLLGSPKTVASPLWATLGARTAFGLSGMSLEASLDALLSARPDLAPSAPLMPVEPRVLLHLGLRYRFGATPPPPRSAPRPPAAPAPKAAPAPPVAPAPAKTSVDLALVDDRGQPLEHAHVTVGHDDEQAPLVEVEPGHYRLQHAKPGPAHLRIEADGFKPVERDIDVGGGGALHLDVKAEPALPPGQVRGLVRSFRGKPLAASIRLEPGGAEGHTDVDGFFQIDVPPGEYEVVIEAAGYQAQRRKAKVDEQGVVIVNADLVKAP